MKTVTKDISIVLDMSADNVVAVEGFSPCLEEMP